MDKNVAKTAGGYLCLPCGKVLKAKQSLYQHFRDLHFYPEVMYTCPVCKKSYRGKNSIKTHVSRYHKDLKGLDLELCKLPKTEENC